jgi:oxalate decarboxylase/phosphoglucose isomerase-like protein (cupin superfamily)
LIKHIQTIGKLRFTDTSIQARGAASREDKTSGGREAHPGHIGHETLQSTLKTKVRTPKNRKYQKKLIGKPFF